jgi:hypothetical protein
VYTSSRTPLILSVVGAVLLLIEIVSLMHCKIEFGTIRGFDLLMDRAKVTYLSIEIVTGPLTFRCCDFTALFDPRSELGQC